MNEKLDEIISDDEMNVNTILTEWIPDISDLVSNLHGIPEADELTVMFDRMSEIRWGMGIDKSVIAELKTLITEAAPKLSVLLQTYMGVSLPDSFEGWIEYMNEKDMGSAEAEILRYERASRLTTRLLTMDAQGILPDLHQKEIRGLLAELEFLESIISEDPRTIDLAERLALIETLRERYANVSELNSYADNLARSLSMIEGDSSAVFLLSFATYASYRHFEVRLVAICEEIDLDDQEVPDS